MSPTRKVLSQFLFIPALLMASSAQAQWMPWDGWTPRGQPLPWDGWWYQYGQQPYYYVPPMNGSGQVPAPAPATAQCPEVPAAASCDDSEQLQQLRAEMKRLKDAHAATIKRLEAQLESEVQTKAQTKSQARIDELQAQLTAAQQKIKAQIAASKNAAEKHDLAIKQAQNMAAEPLKLANDKIAGLKQNLVDAKLKIAQLEKAIKRSKGQVRAATAARSQCVNDAESERESAAQRLSKLQTQLKQCSRLAEQSKGLQRQLQDQLQDSDGDGVINAADRCPASAKGATVTANGCEADDDADGVSNRLDLCLDSTPKASVAADGCEKDKAITLPDVQFVSGSAQLLPAAKTRLDALAKKLSQMPEFRAEVAGHTDSIGDAALNLRLSTVRAQAVTDYLIAKGVAKQQLSAKGYGETQAIADNSTREGRTKNRRVELRRILVSQ